MLDVSQDTTRTHRVLLRVIRSGSDTLVVVIPSFDTGEAEFQIARKKIGFEVSGDYLLGYCNIGADRAEDIVFEKFEPAPKPTYIPGLS